MKKFNVLERHLEVFDSHFLEASAGTGKTFAIEHLVVRLLLSGQAAIHQIAVLTFTRAATRELKERVRSNILKAVSMLESGKSSWDYVAAILERGETAKHQALSFLVEALASFDDAQIFTIHGFCHKLLREFAFEARIPLELHSPDSPVYKTFLKQTVQDFLRIHLNLPAYSLQQLVGMLKFFRQDVHRMEDQVIQLMEKASSLPPLLNFEEEFHQFNDLLQEFPLIEAQKFTADFLLLKNIYKKMGSEEFVQQAQNLGTILERRKCDLSSFDQLLSPEDYFLDGIEEKNVKVKSKSIDLASLHYPKLWKELEQQLKPLLRRAKDPSMILMRLARDCDQLHQIEKRHFSPDEMIKNMLACLDNPSFLSQVQQRYQIAIVDEFQDTDPVQWNIFKKIFINGNKKIALVGDPKQSIYGFRSADIHTYAKAAETLGKNQHYFLDCNHRSDPKLVSSLNFLFSREFSGEWLSTPGLEKSLQYHQVDVHSEAKDHLFTDAKQPVHFFIVEDESGREKNWPTQAMEEIFLFPFMAEEITRLVETQQFSYSQIAILVKDRFQAARLSAFFKKYHIPSSVKKSKKLEEASAFFALQEILRAMRDPEDLNLIKQVLVGSFFKTPFDEIKGGFENEILLQARVLFHRLELTLRRKGLEGALEELFNSHWKGKTVLEQLMFLNGADFFLELRQVSELLLEMQDAPLLSVDQLLLHMQLLLQKDRESEISCLLEERKGVSLMTIHSSKGLEFEIVFALGLANRHFQREVADFLSELLHREESGEKMRYLYVALTRAKKRVYIPLAIEKEMKEYPINKFSPIELFLDKILKENALYQNNLKNWIYDEEVLQNFRQERETIVREQGSREDGNFGAKPTRSKTDSSSCFGINPQTIFSLMKRLEEKQISSFEYLTARPHFHKEVSVDSLRPLVSPTSIRPPEVREIFYSFSSLVKKTDNLLRFSEKGGSSSQDWEEAVLSLPESRKEIEKNELPLGTQTGILLHSIVENIFKNNLHHPLAPFKIKRLIEESIEFSVLEGHGEKIFELVEAVLKMKIFEEKFSFSLADLLPEEFFVEMEFLFPLTSKEERHFSNNQQPFVKGFADLVFIKEGHYFILDWKSNWLGSQEEDYSPAAMEKCIKEHQYDLQASLYSIALERYVKLFDNRPFKEVFGGVLYVFLRGKKIYHFFPTCSLFLSEKLNSQTLSEQKRNFHQLIKFSSQE